MTLKGDAISKQRLTGDLKNDIRNLNNFHESSRQSEDLHDDRFVFSKAYKALEKKVQKSYVSWHWRVIHKEKLILDKYAFFCYKIDLKQ